MIEFEFEPVGDGVDKYFAKAGTSPLSFGQILAAWQRDEEFALQFAKTLADSKFAGFRWETPPLTRATLERPFEFVLLDAFEFTKRSADTHTYAEHFASDAGRRGVVVFDNLSGDAKLVVPTPLNGQSDFGHLADFVRNAPADQIQTFWRAVGETTEQSICERPIWLNTAGGGVAWLHVRLDSRPKYYGYAPYKKTPYKKTPYKKTPYKKTV